MVDACGMKQQPDKISSIVDLILYSNTLPLFVAFLAATTTAVGEQELISRLYMVLAACDYT